MTEAVLRLSLRCDRTAPRRTREALDLIDGITSIREDAKLVATELITDAIMRSEGTSNELIKVTATLRRDQLTISVHRPRDSDQAPQFRPNELEQRRLGLLIVDRIARRWGTEHADGRVVWAELTAASEKLDPSPHSAPSS
ncbi:MAG: ATP-binding protein [Solirubrobacteraceae bacterium]